MVLIKNQPKRLKPNPWQRPISTNKPNWMEELVNGMIKFVISENGNNRRLSV